MVLEWRDDEMNYINHHDSISPGGRALERGENSPSPRPSPARERVLCEIMWRTIGAIGA